MNPPIYLDPIIDILDNSKMSAFKQCPRKYFFSHILGWKSTHPNIHLVFGSAWHSAQEILTKSQSVDQAMQEFLLYYREVYSPAVDEDNSPKNPQKAKKALTSYLSTYRDWYEKHTVLYTEIGVPVPLGEDRIYHTKIDKLMKRNSDGRVFPLDHKTGSRETSYWSDQWQGRNQFIGYLHAVYCVFDFHKVEGLLVDGTLFYKSSPARHKRTWVRKNPRQMEAWLHNITWWYDRIRTDISTLLGENPDKPVMESFPLNDEACVSFNRLCPFFHYCHSSPNPLKYWRDPDDCPESFEVKHWNPAVDPVSCQLNTSTGEIVKIPKLKPNKKDSPPEIPEPITGILGSILGETK